MGLTHGVKDKGFREVVHVGSVDLRATNTGSMGLRVRGERKHGSLEMDADRCKIVADSNL
jgi:hypothetical protein